MTATLQEVMRVIAECDDGIKSHIVFAQVLQLTECFRQFCVSIGSETAWIVFLYARSSIDHDEERKIIAARKCKYLLDELSEQLESSAIPAQDALLILLGALQDKTGLFSDATRLFFHVVGFLNLRLCAGGNQGQLDWIDLNVTVQADLERALKPYLDYCARRIDRDELNGLVELYSINDLMCRISLVHPSHSGSSGA